MFWAGEQDMVETRDSATVHDSTLAMIDKFRTDYGDSVPMIFVFTASNGLYSQRGTCLRAAA